MAVSGTESVTERIERLGREANMQKYERSNEQLSQPQDSWSRACRTIESSIRRQPLMWVLAGVGLGCLIGGTYLVRDRYYS